ncbi:MAG: DUF4340 domain-containing protein, partial [Opitutaceae bacterium]|nr:DUF4340 domain-containing protein [Opitutaceae bacterium]
LFLIVLVLSLGAVAYYIHDVTLVNEQRNNQQLVFPVEMVNVDHLEVSFADRTPPGVVLERRSGRWELTQPVRWPANFFAVNRMLTQLQYLEKVNSFAVASLAENNQTLADFGLDPAAPNGWLVLGRGGARHTVRLGRNADTNTRMYLLPEDSDRIFVVDNAIRATLALTADQLRSPSVFSLQEFEVRFWSVHLTEQGNAQTPGTAASNVRIHLARDGERWKLETPIEARAQTAAVKTLLGEITKLQVLDFVPPEQVDLTLLGLASPAIRITLEGAGRREGLLIGNAVTGEARPVRYYAKLEDSAGQDHSAVFTIAPEFLADVRNAQVGLRERRILEFDRAAVQSVRISDASQREITVQLLENGAWQVSSRTPEQGLLTMPGDSARIDTLLQELAELSALPDGRGFVRDAALGADLESYGLTGATAWQVEITERGGNGAGEPRSQRLLIGRTSDEAGRPVYARLENRGFVYLVDRALVDELSTRAIDYRSRQILSLGEGPRITGLSLTNLGSKETALSVTLPPGQTWEQALAQESPARRAAIIALTRVLPQLRAGSIVNAEFTAVIPGDTSGRAWTWQLQATITTDTGAVAQNSTFSLYLDAYAGGTALLVAAPDPGLVFMADQALIDAFGPLVFERPDPDKPAAAPTPTAPETAPAP